MYSCPGCGYFMTYDIKGRQMKCSRCDRTESVEDVDAREARKAGSSFALDLLNCPTCGAAIQAVNTASAAFCSYCGASVMLERQDAEMEAPETVAPFRVTREECFEKYKSMLSKSLCADHRLKQDVSAESFRGIYVPFYEYAGAVQGEAALEGHQTKGDDTYYYKTKGELNHSFSHILHDASREMPDKLSEKIANVPEDAFVPFTPAYLSGFYADIPDAKEDAYLDYARAETVRNGLNDVIGDLKDSEKGVTYDTGAAEKKLLPMARAECTGRTLVPVWFMSIRSRGRVLYAIQNGVTGEMVADVPMDIPRFGLIALIVTIPLFFLLNSFLTLRPEMVMIAAMALALISQLIINLRRNNIRDTENAEKAVEGQDDLKERLKQRKKAARGAQGALLESLGGYGLLGVAVIGMYFLSKVDNIAYFKMVTVVLTAAMAGLMLWGGKSGVKAPVGCFAALLMMIAGCVILVLDPFHSADMPIYLVSFLILAAVIWQCVDLLLLHNRSCSNPLPQFESHQGGEDLA